MTTRSRQTFEQLVTLPDLAIPLAETALLLACEEYPQLSLGPYLDFLDRAADRVRVVLSGPGTTHEAIDVLNTVLFEEYGFRGNRTDYYDARNSFLNDVIDRRTGIPIALSTIYMAVADRIGLSIEGVGVPGHFVVRHRAHHEEVFIDPFNGGALLTRNDLVTLAASHGEGAESDASWLRRSTHRQILMRMLNNLRVIYVRSRTFDKALAMVDLMLITDPDVPDLYRQRGVLRIELRDFQGAARDLRRYLRRQAGVTTVEVRESARRLARIQAMLN